ncbi:hypothetical protein PtA15_17A422 [Puccinia triticina]|uniref:Uncharacterized protein n=1 Tax=Puccinia triticina TaxID=208348 RepID=A0ABY7D7S1_9BASI|nr:uncharacterized protein PtA15_17A422 [Puccinia triticina]WAQ92940.1 hypothetical protein PtA15_17A422 [Puccinia triticina]
MVRAPARGHQDDQVRHPRDVALLLTRHQQPARLPESNDQPVVRVQVHPEQQLQAKDQQSLRASSQPYSPK